MLMLSHLLRSIFIVEDKHTGMHSRAHVASPYQLTVMKSPSGRSIRTLLSCKSDIHIPYIWFEIQPAALHCVNQSHRSDMRMNERAVLTFEMISRSFTNKQASSICAPENKALLMIVVVNLFLY